LRGERKRGGKCEERGYDSDGGAAAEEIHVRQFSRQAAQMASLDSA